MSSPSLYDPFLGSHQGEKEFDDFKRTATANRENPAATANSSSLHSITEPAPIPNIMDLRDPADEEVDSSEDVTDDRAETVVRLVVSDFEQISEDEANTDNADDGQVQESLTNHHLLTPAESDQNSDASTPSEHDEAAPESDEPDMVSKSKKKYPSSLNKAKKRKAAAVEEFVVQPKRELRTRTHAQEHPYEADKLNHSMTKSRGRNLSKAELEKQLSKAKQPTKPKPKSKSKTASQPRERARSVGSISTSICSVAPSSLESEAEAVSDEYKRQHTNLCLALQESPEIGIEACLADFATLADLLTFVNKRWGAVKHGTVECLTCERPWKDKQNLAIYEGWDEQYQVLDDSILEAPFWRKKSKSSTHNLKVNIIVTLKPDQLGAP